MVGFGRFVLLSAAVGVVFVLIGGAAIADVSGTWALNATGVSVGCTVNTPCKQPAVCGVDVCGSFDMGGNINVSQSGSALNAAANDINGMPYTLTGTVNGSNVTFTIQGYGITPGIGAATTTYTGTLSAGKITGTFSGQASWTYTDGSGNPVTETATWTGTFAVTIGAAAGGSITGNVAYAGSKTGTIYIGVFKGLSGISPGVPNPAYSAVLSAPGTFTIQNVPDGTYYVGAIMTTNPYNIAMDDPYGIYGGTVTVRGGVAPGVNITLTDGTSQSPNPFYIPRHIYEPLLGTWGYIVLRNDTDGKWYSRAGSVTFNSEGKGLDSYMNNANGTLGGGKEAYEYSAVQNSDGTITVYYIYPNRVMKHRYIISDDGNQIIEAADDPPQQRMRLMGRLDTSSAHSNSDLNGEYYSIGYEHNARPVSPPNGNGSNMAISSITAFNGSGQYTYEGVANSDGLTWNDSGSGSYSVSPDGSLTVGGGGIGGIGAGGRLALLSSTSPDQWAAYSFMKKGDRTYSTSDMAGTWAITGFGDTNGASFGAEYGTATCDSAGNCNLSIISHVDGVVVRRSDGATVTIAADGSFGSSISGMAPSSAGAIGNGGQTIIANMTFGDEQSTSRVILFGIRCSSCTDVQPARFTLSASKAGTGSGIVKSTPEGISCGTDCSETYQQGQGVILVAAPDAGAVFEGWSGACSGTGACLMTMDSDKTVTAQFRQEQVQPANTKLTLSASSRSILRNAPLNASGKLSRQPDIGSDMTGLPIDLIITRPDGTTVVHSTTTALDGSYSFHGLNDFTSKGTYTLKASFSGTATLAAAYSEAKKVVVNAVSGYAIIVEGRIADGSGLDSHNKTANRIYDSLTDRGFTDDNINFFSYKPSQQGNIVDATPSKSAIKAAIETWAKGKMNASAAPLYIVMVDHGNNSAFYINNETISPSDLASWLGKLESGLSAEALQEKRVVVIGACYSGSFIQGVSKDGRVVITSARATEQSYKGEMEDDGIRSGEFFLDELFTQLGRGVSLGMSFEYASVRTQNFTNRASLNSSLTYIDGARQHPLLDDNGDGRGSTRLSSNGDGLLAGQLYLGSGYTYNPLTFANSTEITEARETVFLSASSASAILWAKVASTASSAWVEIRKPSVTTAPSGGSNQITLELPRVALSWNAGLLRWEGTYDQFTETGKYELFYYARDKTTGKISPVRRAVIYKDREGNTPPSAAGLVLPAETSVHETVVTLDWTDSTDPDGDAVTYTVMVSKDPAFGSIDYLKEEIGLSTTFAGLQDELSDLTVWYWKVRAIDFYGGRQDSGVGSFITINDNTNACGGRVYGTVRDGVTQRGIPAASVSAGSGSTVSALPDGFYLLTASSGSVTVTASAGGYTASSLTEEVAPCGSANVDISLEPKDRCASTLSADLTLYVPIINYASGAAYLKAEFVYMPTTDGNVVFELKGYGEAEASEYSGCATTGLTTDLKLSLPLINYDAMSLWADLEYVPSGGPAIVFKVTNAGVR